MRHCLRCFFGQAWDFFRRDDHIVMDASDALGSSSFNSGLDWTGGAASVAGNAYQTASFLLRTPANTTSIAFAGNSLEIQSGGDLRDKTAATVTVTNLILDNNSTLELTEPGTKH